MNSDRETKPRTKSPCRCYSGILLLSMAMISILALSSLQADSPVMNAALIVLGSAIALAALLISLLLRRHDHKQLDAIAALEASNQQLQATEQQLRASNQQLEAGEQQLRTLNQQLRASEGAARASEQRYRSVVVGNPAGMHLYELEADGHLVLRDANPSADRILGIAHAALLGRSIEEAFPNLVNTEVPAQYRKLAADGGSWIKEEIAYQDEQILGVFAVTAFQTSPGRMAAAFTDITELRRAQLAQQANEAAISSIFRAAPIGIGLVVNRVLSRVNNRICELTGYAPEELIGQSSRLLYPTDEDFNHVGREKYEQIRAQGTGTVETRWRRKDGRILEVLLSSTPLDAKNLSAGVTFTALEISDMKRMTAERDRLFNLSVDMFCIAGFDGFFKQLNPAWSRALGWTQEELLSHPWIEFAHPDDRERTRVAHACLMEGKPVVAFENRFLCKDGSCRSVSWNSFPLPEEKCIFAVVRDVTEANHARDEMQKMQKLESLGVLAGGIAHDFNNLLGGLFGYLDLARESVEQGDAKNAGHSLSQALGVFERAKSLTQQLLTFSKGGSR